MGSLKDLVIRVDQPTIWHESNNCCYTHIFVTTVKQKYAFQKLNAHVSDRMSRCQTIRFGGSIKSVQF